MKRNSCKPHRESLCLLASGALPESERPEIEAHLAACADCRRYFNELRSLAVPLANWEKGFAHIEPGPSFQRRWENAILSADQSKSARSPATKIDLQKFWREWLRPFRYAWAGMAALWLVMASMNFGLSRSEPNRIGAQARSTPETLQAFEEQRRVLAELVSSENDPVAPPHRTDSRPRSARQQKVHAA
jgi:anti-sigma factor RsiW